MITVNDCPVVNIKTIVDNRGNLGIVEKCEEIKFTPKRVYFLYDVPDSSERGGHAHKILSQLIIAVNGSFEITINDGVNSKVHVLSNPRVGLIIRPGIWRTIKNFTYGAVCLVAASHKYDEGEYIRDYNLFLKMKDL